MNGPTYDDWQPVKRPEGWRPVSKAIFNPDGSLSFGVIDGRLFKTERDCRVYCYALKLGEG